MERNLRAGAKNLSIEWNSIRLGGAAHGLVTKTTQNSTRVTFCLSITEPCAVISIQISSRFTGEIVYWLHCMSLFAFFLMFESKLDE